MRFFFGVLLIFGLVMSGCSKLPAEKAQKLEKAKKDVFYVVFAGAPAIFDDNVYFSGKKIGTILDKAVGSGRILKVSVSIDDGYKNYMKENVVFYEDYGKLFYDVVDNFGKPLLPGANILGFDSKTSLAWFKTRTLLTRSSYAAIKKANRLSAMAGFGS